MDHPRTDPTGTTQWYYMYGGESYGPIASSKLRHLIASAELPDDTLVWREGMHDWLPASELGLTTAPAIPIAPPVIVPGSRATGPATTAAGELGHASEAIHGRSRPRREVTPRRSANAKRWAWTITGAISLLVAGYVIGYVIHKGSSRQIADMGAVDADQPMAKKARGSTSGTAASRRTSTAPPKPEPTSSRSTSDDEAGGSTPVPPLISSPLRTSGAPADAGVMSSEERGTTESSKAIGVTDPEERTDGPPSVLYQEVLIHRRPSFGMLTMAMTQDIQYMILSKLTLQPRVDDGSFRVAQEVLSTRLDRADEMSHGTYESALQKLKGNRFLFTLNAKSEVINFDGYERELAAVPVESGGSTGFQMTHVLDKDGWKELIQLSFLEPARHIAPGQNWTRQMAHDWSPLGRWTGTTTFSQDTGKGPPGLYFNYTHDMTYTPSATTDSAMPFSVSDAEFRLVSAGGTFVYDPVAQHVTRVDESFHVKGSVGTELMGESAKLQLEERQQLTITLTAQPPSR